MQRKKTELYDCSDSIEINMNFAFELSLAVSPSLHLYKGKYQYHYSKSLLHCTVTGKNPFSCVFTVLFSFLYMKQYLDRRQNKEPCQYLQCCFVGRLLQKTQFRLNSVITGWYIFCSVSLFYESSALCFSLQLYVTVKRNCPSFMDRTYIKHTRLFSCSHLRCMILFFCPLFCVSGPPCSHGTLVRWCLLRTFLARTISSLSHLSGWQRSKNRSFSSHVLASSLYTYLLSNVATVSLNSVGWPPPLDLEPTTARLSLPEYPAIYEFQKHRGHLFMKHS